MEDTAAFLFFLDEDATALSDLFSSFSLEKYLLYNASGDIEEGNFTYSTDITHTHEGSIGNLGTEYISAMMQQAIASFGFEKYHTAIERLLR